MGQQDPGWPVPFSKRSEYFALFEQYLLDSEGCSRDEAARNRTRANIIVDPTWISETGGPGTHTFTDLQDGLTQAKEGDIIFLEPGFYYREEGFKVHSSCTIIGA